MQGPPNRAWGTDGPCASGTDSDGARLTAARLQPWGTDLLASAGDAGLGRDRIQEHSVARWRAHGPGAGPGWWDGDRLVTLCWAHLIRSDSGPAGRVVDRAGLGPERPPGGDCRGWGSGHTSWGLGSCRPERFWELTRMARSWPRRDGFNLAAEGPCGRGADTRARGSGSCRPERFWELSQMARS